MSILDSFLPSTRLIDSVSSGVSQASSTASPGGKRASRLPTSNVRSKLQTSRNVPERPGDFSDGSNTSNASDASDMYQQHRAAQDRAQLRAMTDAVFATQNQTLQGTLQSMR